MNGQIEWKEVYNNGELKSEGNSIQLIKPAAPAPTTITSQEDLGIEPNEEADGMNLNSSS